MGLSTWLILSSFVCGSIAKQVDKQVQWGPARLNRKISKEKLEAMELNTLGLAAEKTTTGSPEVDQKEKPIFGGWIYVGDLTVGCHAALSSAAPTDVSVLFDTGSSVLVLKTQKTFDVVAKEECNSIEEMFTEVTGCNAGTCGKCYQHTSCYKDHKKDYQITYGSGPVEVAMGTERIEVAGQVIDGVPVGEVKNFNVKTFMRKDFQGIAGLMHNANGAKDDGHSLFQALRSKGMESFGYCINNQGESQLYWFDDRHVPDGARKVPVVCQHHWGVTASAIAVGKHDVKPELDPNGYGLVSKGGKPAPNLCGDAPCVAIVDTGTNFIVGPNPIIEKSVELIVKAGFREDCMFDYAALPDLVFTLEKDSFHVKPHHYIVEQQMKSKAGVPVKVCALLLGPMEGALQKSSKAKLNAATGKEGSMSNVIILGTPFMRSNYIRFTHPIGKDPYIMIHDKCPEDFSAKEKAKIEKASNKTVKIVHKQIKKSPQGVRFVEVTPHGDLINRVRHDISEEPALIRKDEETSGAKMVKKNMQVLQQLGGEWLTKDWMAAMDEGRECTPGQKMNFTHTAWMGATHALSPSLILIFSALVAIFNI